MATKQPWLWIIGGPNGAWKTTFCMEFLPRLIRTHDYINADLIAAGLSPLDPSQAPVAAGKIMLERAEELLRARRTFAVESTLAGKTFLHLAKRAKAQGWKIGVDYLWLSTDEIALKRVADRVKLGGHPIPKETVIRRRLRGLAGLAEYLELADQWTVFDNSGDSPIVVAWGDGNGRLVELPDTFAKMGLR